MTLYPPDIADRLSWLGDVVATHWYRQGVPLPMRRRVSFDGTHWDVTDDAENDTLVVTLDPDPDFEGDDLLASSIALTRTLSDTEGTPATEGAVRLADGGMVAWRSGSSNVAGVYAQSGNLYVGTATGSFVSPTNLTLSAGASVTLATQSVSVVVDNDGLLFVADSVEWMGEHAAVRDISFETELAAGTTNGTLTTIALGASNGEFIVEVYAVARGGATDCAGYHLIGVAKVRSSVATLMGSSTFMNTEDDTSWSLSLAASGTNILVRGTSDASDATTFTGFVRVTRRLT